MNLHEWRSRIRTRSNFSSNILRNPRRNAPPRRTRCLLPRHSSAYSLDPRLSLLPLHFCLSVAYHGQVRTLPYPSFGRYFNPHFVFQNSPSNQALPPPLRPLSGTRMLPLSPPLAILLVPVHLSKPITHATPIMLLNALLTTRRVRITGKCLIVHACKIKFRSAR
jgi:hypothetical protein